MPEKGAGGEKNGAETKGKDDNGGGSFLSQDESWEKRKKVSKQRAFSSRGKNEGRGSEFDREETEFCRLLRLNQTSKQPRRKRAKKKITSGLKWMGENSRGSRWVPTASITSRCR